MKAKKTERLVFSLILPIFLIIPFNFNMFYLFGDQPVKQRPEVSVRFRFDERLKPRPYRVFLKKESEWDDNLDRFDPNRVQFYETGKLVYDFYSIPPGVYWLGISFKMLRKDGSVIESEYVKRQVKTGIDETNFNRVVVQTTKRIILDLNVRLELFKRKENEHDPSGNDRVVKRPRPKTGEEKMMLDENYFFLGAGFYDHVERTRSEQMDYKKITFVILGYDDLLRLKE